MHARDRLRHVSGCSAWQTRFADGPFVIREPRLGLDTSKDMDSSLCRKLLSHFLVKLLRVLTRTTEVLPVRPATASLESRSLDGRGISAGMLRPRTLFPRHIMRGGGGGGGRRGREGEAGLGVDGELCVRPLPRRSRVSGLFWTRACSRFPAQALHTLHVA